MISNQDYLEELYTDLLYVHDDVAVAEVSLWVGDELVSATGVSKRDNLDKPDHLLAALLSYGRALESISQKLLRRANGLIKHHDDMRLKEAEAGTECWCGVTDCDLQLF